jgi:hypothetical protein
MEGPEVEGAGDRALKVEGAEGAKVYNFEPKACANGNCVGEARSPDKLPPDHKCTT